MKPSLFSLLTAAGLLCAIAVQSQTTEQRLSLSIGLNALSRQDLVFSPFVHSAKSFTNFGLTWERKKRLSQSFELRFSNFAASHSDTYEYSQNPDPEIFTTAPHDFTFVELNYGLSKFWQRGRTTFQLGGVLENSIQLMNYNTGPFSFFGYFTSFGVGPSFSASLPVGQKGKLDFAISAPLISWVARSPYLVNDDEFIENTTSHKSLSTLVDLIGDGSLQFPDKLQKLSFSASYLHAVSKRWDMGLAYRMQFIRHTEPLPLTSYEHNFSILFSRKSD